MPGAQHSFGRKQSAAAIEIHRLEKALAKAELERDVAREMLIERSTPDPGRGRWYEVRV